MIKELNVKNIKILILDNFVAMLMFKYALLTITSFYILSKNNWYVVVQIKFSLHHEFERKLMSTCGFSSFCFDLER